MSINEALEKILEQKNFIETLEKQQSNFLQTLIYKIYIIKSYNPIKRFFIQGRLLNDLIQTIESAIDEQNKQINVKK